MKNFKVQWNLALIATLIIILTSTLPRLLHGKTHTVSDHGILHFLVIALLSVFIIPIIDSFVNGFLGRLFPAWFFRKLFRKETVVVFIMVALTILFNLRYHSPLRSIGHMATNLIYLHIFFKKGFLPSVATSATAGIIVGAIYLIAKLILQ